MSTSSAALPYRIAVAGASGRMGRMLIQAVDQTEGMQLAGALELAVKRAGERMGVPDK